MGLFYESDKNLYDLLDEKKNFVFIGEAGSGKSEIALNIAAMLAEKHKVGVDFFDLDQTKALYRSRDLKETFALRNVNIHFRDQFFDAPVMVGGVRSSLLSDNYTILDIGGGQQAAKFAGAYSDLISKSDSLAVYVFNSYRPWSGNVESIDVTMRHILSSMRIDHIYLLANPNLGYKTDSLEFAEGLKKTDELFGGYTYVNSACVRRELYEEASHITDKTLIPIDLYLGFSWIEKDI